MRFRNGLALLKASWAVVRSDRQLLWLPVLSGVSTLVVAAIFGLPIYLQGRVTTALGEHTFRMQPFGWFLLAVGYVAVAYVGIFFNAALVYAANERFEGRPATVSDAIAGARRRAGTILPWAVVSATVSLVLRSLESRSGLLGRLVIGLVGLAWSLVTFLVLPIIVFEELRVGAAIKRSTALFRQTWGENVVGNGGIGVVALLAMLGSLVVVALFAATGNGVITGIGIALAVAWWVVVAVVTSALGAVFQTALYRYAANREVMAGFDESMLSGAFRPRGRTGPLSI